MVRCALSVVVASVALCACTVAPGMRMARDATSAPGQAGSAASRADTGNVGNAATRAGTASADGVPIHEIDAALLAQLRDGAASTAAPDLFSTTRPYTLGAGDVLQITVWDHPELAAALGAQPQTQARAADAPAGFVVDDTGSIQFPYAGSVQVAGLKTDEARERLARRLANVFRNPQVTVRVASFRSAHVYVDGEVHTPGVQPINDIPMTLYEAVSRAGGFTTAADQSRMVLVRDGRSYPVNLSQLFEQQRNPAKIVLRDGDLLRVVSRDENGVYVLGEINRPATAVPMKTGRLTLSDALSQAGSLNQTTADAAQMYVIRGALSGAPSVYHLDARSPVAMLLANQFELQPKDVVYVDSTGLARFSRVLSQLLPAINAGLTAAVVGK
ncbi:polysaccharide biosynthesis/export family protein [Paraburkholderia rhizosphaerae]|uniref:Polysaccharide export outer membrane protein n=1 Tax=Paraburkholderia rhizosphaerae TaxID=480658 RepID=A0A4R8LLE2_9BURK|nr:polysaccharide biosynthesis/export family protein [Paraburkholderia rhizosphaerae]TDY45352.1 polysaccharide export outer membrane protein [Paraburkholderia rhizosphaerae]